MSKEFVVESEFSLFIESLITGEVNEGLYDKFKSQVDFITNIAKSLKIGFKDLLKMFKNRSVIKFFNGIKWSFKQLFELIRSGYDAYKNLIKAIFEYTSKNKVAQWTTEKIRSLDEWLKQHPKLKRLGGFAVSGILVYIWLNMSFTGDFEYDFDFTDVIHAILGEYSLETIFAGANGIKLLTLFASGMFLGLSFPWGGPTSVQMIFGVMKSLNNKFNIIKVPELKKKFLSEAIERVEIKTLKKMAEEEPTFIFMMGGTGAGKNYVFKKYLNGLPLIDIDEYTAEFAKQYDTDPRKQVSRATQRSKKELLDAFSKNKTIVQMGTGNNVDSSSNKFKWAKDAGMKVVVLLVDVDSKTALKRNKERHAGGEQRLVPDDKVIRTVEVAKLNTEKYRKDPNVDSVIIYKN